MAHQVIMPTLGLTMEEGTITEWLKEVGDQVAKEEPLFVVETDKSAVEVGAPAGGVLARIIVAVGETVPVSTPIAVIAQPGESAVDITPAMPGSAIPGSAGVPPAAGRSPAAPAGPDVPGSRSPGSETALLAGAPRIGVLPGTGDRLRISPRARMVAQQLGVDITTVSGSGPEGRVVERDVRATAATPIVAATATAERIVASPLARRLAAEYGVDLAQIKGTGPNGRITEKDVTAFAQSRQAVPVATPAASSAPAAPPPIAAAVFEPLNRVRRITAERMAASARSVASVTLLMEVDMTEAVRFRGQLAPEFERRYGARLAYDAMIAKAAAIALAEHPHVNARWQEATEGQPAGLRLQPQINVGVAVQAEQGLLVVVARDVDQKPLHQVNSEMLGLVEKGRQNRLGPDDMSGGTFTVTNLGGYDVEAFTPIVNPPESAILGVGRIGQHPAVVDGQVTVRDLMYLNLSFDHRVVDGAPAAQFLQRIKQVLEAPYILLA